MRRFFSALALACLLATAALAAEGFPPSSTPTVPGIDVSSWQREIDWARVRAAGIEIAMLRASEGTRFVDPYFDTNDTGARAAGVKVGYYHFLTAQTEAEAVAQADHFISVIGGRVPDCLLAVDYGGGGNLTGEALTANAEAFLERVAVRTGYGVMLYTDAWAAKARYGASIARYPIWVANYGVSEPEANGKWRAWVGFQYYDKGDIPGIRGYVDLDRFTREVYQRAEPTPTPEPTPEPTPAPGSETLYYEAQAEESVEDAARRLNTAQADLRALNDIVGGAFGAGQIVRYPSRVGSSGEAFSGLHILQARESLYTIARRYGTTADALARLNALGGRSVIAGQVLRVPDAPGRSVKQPPSWLLENVVVALPGQTIESIAMRYGIPADELRTINGLTADDALCAGQILHLQTYGRDEIVGFTGGYAVRRGDTLVRIAERFGTTAGMLYAINNIENRSLIYPGQILLLPEP